MKTLCLYAAVLALTLVNASGQAKMLTNDPLTGLPLIPATVVSKNVGNEPDKMPDGRVCKSNMQGNFYSLFSIMNPTGGIKMDAAATWYASHLSGYKKVQGYESGPLANRFLQLRRNHCDFRDRTTRRAGRDADAYAVAYERYQPGISEKTITSLTQGKIVCP